jgi:hypothetical protein
MLLRDLIGGLTEIIIPSPFRFETELLSKFEQDQDVLAARWLF